MATLVWATLLLAAFTTANAIGNEVTIQEHPYIVQIELGARMLWTQQCAGVVLTSYHILSAASCFSGPIEYRRCRAGTAIRRGEGSTIVPFVSAKHHPDFYFDADITITFLGTRLPLDNYKMAQVSIIGQGIQLPTGLGVQKVGWGTIAEGSAISSNTLFSGNMVVTNNDACALQYIYEKPITENHFCISKVGGSGRDYDPRDLGAPVMYQNTLVGLVSYGKRNANDEFPVVATNVGSYTDWIIENAHYTHLI